MSTLRVNAIQNTSGVQQYLCKAWVNFNGTGTTATNQTIRSSGNVSSVYKNGTGDYTVNFTTALADANYAVAGSATFNASSTAIPRMVAPTSVSGFSTTNCQIRVADDTGTYGDCNAVNVVIFGN